MLRKNIVEIACFFCLLHLNVNAQDHECKQCPGGCEAACGPLQSKNSRTQITLALDQFPYPFIVHQEVKRLSSNYSTGAFIAPNVLITAHHNVLNSGIIRKLSFCNKSVNPNEWIQFRRKDLKILKFGKANAPTDIALIIFPSTEAVIKIYRGHFQVGAVGYLNDTVTLHLTGFSCDMPDTLIEKKSTFSNFLFHESESLIGYQLFTCTGDSGAPLWYSDHSGFKIIGIHHGGNEGYFSNPDTNISSRITKEMVDWISRAISHHHEHKAK